jgi:hypothetical protein
MKLSTAKNYFEDFHKDGEADKFIDLFPVDKYRTDNLSIPLFKFDYSAFPVNSSHISYFDKNLKNPKANELPLQERVPLTHYKTEEIKQPHVEDVFENNIIQNQKNIKIPRKELPEKYAYGLDHKGLGDIAYERLDIENGDTNELSRNLENFYEDQYLKQVEPQKMKQLETINKTITKYADKPDKQEKVGRAHALKEQIEVEIPEILGKNPKYHNEEDIYKKYRPLQNKADRVLSQKELYEINNILISHGEKSLPVGTRSKAAARKINLINDSFGVVNEAENAATKIQAKVRQKKAAKELNDAKNAATKIQSKYRQKKGKVQINEMSGMNAEDNPSYNKKIMTAKDKKPSSLSTRGFEESKSSGGILDSKTEEMAQKELREMEELEKELEEQGKVARERIGKIKDEKAQKAWKKFSKKTREDKDNKVQFENLLLVKTAGKKLQKEKSRSPISAGGGGGKASTPNSPSRTPQNKMDMLLVYKKRGKDITDLSLVDYSEKELSDLIDNSPKKINEKEKDELIKHLKKFATPSANLTLEYFGGIDLSDFSENIKQVQDIYEILNKSPGDSVTQEQMRVINKYIPKQITAKSGRVRVGQALKELEQLFIEETNTQKIKQLPIEGANIVTPMQTPLSKKSSV